jgi:hypothetical protein
MAPRGVLIGGCGFRMPETAHFDAPRLMQKLRMRRVIKVSDVMVDID